MKPNKYIDNYESLILLFICILAICYFCVSCSNGKKVLMDENTIDESVQTELDLIEDCIRDFIILATDNPDYYFFDVTLETLEGERGKIKNSEDTWLLRHWFIHKVGSQEPVAKYSYDFNGGQNSKTYTLFLYKQNGVYKVRDWDAEELIFLDEFLEGFRYGTGKQ